MFIEIEKSHPRFSENPLLKIYHQFPQGSITKITGPSGIGKTTFLKIIAGFIRPENGKIGWEKEIWLDTEKKINLPIQKRRVGMVFQDYALFPNMTVYQHLRYGTQDETWIGKLLEIGYLGKHLKDKPKYLSGGEQQRLSILRALAHKPKLLLMDEPFSALDQELRLQIIENLKDLIKEMHLTCLIVSHNPNELDLLSNQELKLSSNPHLGSGKAP